MKKLQVDLSEKTKKFEETLAAERDEGERKIE